MNAKERVMHVFNHQKPDRMPCFGANSTVIYDQMEKVQAFWPDAHFNGEAMIADGIQILAPGCAVAPGTPLENLLALTEVARKH